MDATELGRWTRFAAKGGIGKCSAIQDCVAESPEDLMFLMEDEIIVLLQLAETEGMFLGYCEGVVGRFHASHVRFHGKLKKPVMTKRSSMTAAKSPTPSGLSQPASPLPNIDASRSPATQALHLTPESRLSPPAARLSMTREAEEPPDRPASLVQVTTAEEVPEPKLTSEPETIESTQTLSPESLPSSPLHESPQPIDFSNALQIPGNNIANRQSTMSDGEVGIGLSLLQDVGDDDDWSSIQSRYSTHSGAYSPVSTEEHTVEDDQRTETTHGPPLSIPPAPLQLDHTEPVLPEAMPQSPTASLAPSSMTKRSEDWESGMSDIYDNYRYSRYSMASRNSRFSQSSSQPSMHSIPPPVPDSRSAPRSSIDSEASVYTQNSRASMDRQAGDHTILAPPPLEIDDKAPLLNARWDSPLASPAVSSFSVASGQGVANAIRQRLESEKDLNEPGLSIQDTQIQDVMPSVVDDDEELPSFARDSIAKEDWNSDTGSPLASPMSAQSKSLPPLQTSVSGISTSSASDAATVPAISQPTSPQSPMITITALHTRDVAPLPPTSTTNLSPPTHAPRPSLSELRGYGPGSAQGQGQRQSLFLPHPNAPKATTLSEGPMYIRNPWPVAPPSPSIAAPANAAAFAVTVLRNILQNPRAGARAPLTIYGRLEMDFSKTTGPVPVTFSGEYLPPPPPPLTPKIPSSPLARSASPVVAPAVIPAGDIRSSSPKPIPRPNFFPQGSSPRPKSRSFSEFQYPAPKSPQSSRDPSRGIDRDEPLLANIPPAPSTIGTPASPTLRSSASTPRLHSPSPLSITTNGDGGKPPLRSPLRATTDASHPSSPIRPHQLRQVTSMSAFKSNSSPSPHAILIPKDIPSPPAVTSPTTSPTRWRKQSVETESVRDSRTSIATESDTTRSRLSVEQRESISPISSRSNVISPSPFGEARQGSMRSKLSLPNLRRNQSRAGSLTSTQELSETLQVRDMDFELVRPTIPAITQESPRTSEDGSSIAGTPHSLTDSSRAEIGTPFRRADSPSLSISSAVPSATMPRSPTVPENFGSALSRPPLKSAESEATMEAHRQREGKWVSLMSTIPPSQAKKNKRVRKLVQEGVPSSVRYQVWSHLMDSKARKVPGVYTQLGKKRPNVPSFSDIERDVAECFSEHPQLQNTKGPLLSLLQAYLRMVPDIVYTTGLTLIAGHLLLHSPEEDAFWLFVSMMDAYLRPYFWSNPTQLEVDAALFSKALEGNDAQVFKKLMIDMSITPNKISHPWFSTLFVNALPADYLNRVWDLFLSEGVPILIRTGMAIVYCCRRAILDSKSEEAACAMLRRPNPNWLPPSADAFIVLLNTVKLKDDDVRKQRVKMEQALTKRQAQQQQTVAPRSAASISLPRS